MSDELDRIAADLKSTADQTQKKARAVVRQAGLSVANGARTRAPVDTGFLRSSIRMRNAKSGQRNTVSVEVTASAHYAVYVEYGTSRMGPQPYMAPAADRVMPTFAEAVSRIGGDLL